MAQCVICREFYPPGLTETLENGRGNKCIFCTHGKDRVALPDPQTNQPRIVTRKEIIDDYKRYLTNLRDNPKMKEAFLKSALKEFE